MEDLPSNDQIQIETKNRLYGEAEAATARVKALADCLIALELRGLDGSAYKEERAIVTDRAEAAMHKPLPEFQASASEQLHGRRTFHWPVEFPEVFDHGGFDAFVGNPPFLGAMRIAQAYGDDYQLYLKLRWSHRKGAADLIAYFFLQAFEQLRPGGNLGMIATNTLTQGNTRFVGLDYICGNKGEIYAAVKSMSWPGTANVFISVAHIHKGEWRGGRSLDGHNAALITSSLDDIPLVSEPKTLTATPCYSSRGTTILGIGFVVTHGEANQLRALDSRNSEVLFPYLNAVDFSTSPDTSATREVINFFDWPIEVAKTYPAPFALVFEKVRPQREKPQRQVHEDCYWKFSDKRPELYRSIERMREVLVCGMATKYFAFAFVRARQVFSDKVGVFATEDRAVFGLLSSSPHAVWASHYMYTLKGDPCYSLSACYQTFPACSLSEPLRILGHEYHEFRRQVMLMRQEGLTKTYNLFHDRSDGAEDMTRLRALHMEMDQAVVTAYGWNDLDLDHGFHETKQGVRYTISESARRTVLDRLLTLNYQRHAAEEAEKTAQAVSAPVKRGRKKKGRADKLTLDLL